MYPLSSSKILLIVFFIAVTAPFVNASITLDIEAGQKKCFGTYARVESVISGNFDLLDDELDPDPFSVVFYGPRGNTIWASDHGATEGSFSHTGTGRFELCFENGTSGGDDMDHDDRSVGFAIRLVPINVHDPKAKDGPDDSMTTKLLTASSNLQIDLEALSDHQSYMRMREKDHRELSEKTFARVVRWTMLEALVLLIVAGGQVMYLRKFFERKRML